MSFGEAFGRLIKQKRGIEGLTQQNLAVAAFGDESYKTRISELENGKVTNPQAKTVDALVVALNISQEEIDQLNAEYLFINEYRETVIADSLYDYFDCTKQAICELRLSTTMDGAIALSHNMPLVVSLSRFEFFIEPESLVLLTEEGYRRSFSRKLPEHILERLRTVESIRVILWEKGPQPGILSFDEYPLKTIF